MDCGLETRDDGLAKKLGLVMVSGEDAGWLVAGRSPVYGDVAGGCEGQGNVVVSPLACCQGLRAGVPIATL